MLCLLHLYKIGNFQDLQFLQMSSSSAQLQEGDVSYFLYLCVQHKQDWFDQNPQPQGNDFLRFFDEQQNFKDIFCDGQIDLSGEADKNFTNDQPNEIDDPGQVEQTQGQDSISSKFISTFNRNFENQQQTQQNMANLESRQNKPLYFPKGQNNSDKESKSQRSYLNQIKSKKKREKNENNAHKKMITVVNKAISRKRTNFLKKLIRKQKNQKLNYIKASRYGFIQYLSLIRHFFGSNQVVSLRLNFRIQLELLIDKVRKQENSKARDYLLSLPASYENSFDQFISGSVEQATRIIYRKDTFRQRTYMAEGISHVKNLLNELKYLQA